MPTSSPDLAYTPAHVLRDLVAAKRLSPVELMQFTLDRIERLNESLGAFVTVMADHAMSEARAAEEAVMRGRELGPLHGVPVPIKDLEAVAGVRLSQGSLVDDATAPSNALCTDRVRAAGGIVVGKTNTPEHGHNATTENRVFGPARNPWDPERTPGGSSGGAAAAVAAGITAIAQGSDGGGSIRIPASLSGVYGIKATQGRVPRRYVDEHSASIFNNSSVGPLTWDVRDAAIFLNVLAGPSDDAEFGTLPDEPPDFTTGLSRGVAGLRIGLDTSHLGGACCDPEVWEAVAAAARIFAELGAHVEEVEYAPEEHAALEDTFLDLFCIRAYGRWSVQLHDPEKAALLTDYFAEDLERGRRAQATDYLTCMNKVGRYRAHAARFFAAYDLLLTPATATTAFAIGEYPETVGGKAVAHRRFGFTPFTYLFNLTGNPAATVPCGFDSEGMPVGLQLVGNLEDEMTVLAASAAFESARPWAATRPARPPR